MNELSYTFIIVISFVFLFILFDVYNEDCMVFVYLFYCLDDCNHLYPWSTGELIVQYSFWSPQGVKLRDNTLSKNKPQWLHKKEMGSPFV